MQTPCNLHNSAELISAATSRNASARLAGTDVPRLAGVGWFNTKSLVVQEIVSVSCMDIQLSLGMSLLP